MGIGTKTSVSLPEEVRRFGGPLRASTLAWEVGIVRHCNPITHRYVVGLDGGDVSDIRRISPGPGDIELLPEDTLVLVCTGIPLGPYIWGVVQRPEMVTPLQVTPSGETLGAKLIPGDRFMQGALGNFVGAFAGGNCGIHSTAMARVLTKPDNSVEMFSGTFKHVSMFGDTEITQNGDKVNYSIRGGSSVTAHTGATMADAWTLRIDAGSKGDLLDVRVTDPLGQTLSQLHLGSNGSITVKAAGGRLTRINSSDTRLVFGLDRVRVTEDAVEEVEGRKTAKYGSYEQDVGNTATLSCAQQTTRVRGNRRSLVFGNDRAQVRGDTLIESCGSYTVAVAPSVAATLPMGQAVNWINYGGPFNFVVDVTAVGGAFNVISSLPASVNLAVGGAASYNPATLSYSVVASPGIYSAVLYERLVVWLGNLMNWLDTHVHATAVGPSSPPAVLVSPVLGTTTTDFQSLRVRLGG